MICNDKWYILTVSLKHYEQFSRKIDENHTFKSLEIICELPHDHLHNPTTRRKH